MDTTDQKNKVFQGNRKSENQKNSDKNEFMNAKLYDIDEFKETYNQSNREIAEQGFAVRNGHDPNKPNPDEDQITNDEDDLDDLDDDFHTDKDLEGDDNLDDLDQEIDLEGDEKIVNDEFDNPSDDFNETEEDLEDIDQDDDKIQEEENYKYIEDDIPEEDTKENYPAYDPRKF
jgi:hypothetical protein